MFEQKVLTTSQFPIDQKNRKSTDIICTFLGAAFALSLFILACVLWNKEQFQNKFYNIRNDVKGHYCNDSKLFFNDYTNVTDSTCLKNCPIDYFETEGICLPQSHVTLGQYLENEDISAPLQYNQFKWVLFYSFIIALGLGLIWTMIVHLIPRQAPMIANVGATLSLIAFGVLILVLPDYFWNKLLWLKITIAVVCFLLAIISFIMLCVYANSIKIQGLFLDYSVRFLSRHPSTYIYLPLHIAFMVGLVALIVWQHCCFTSKFADSRNFWNFANANNVWEIFNILEFIWAAQFLRDSFNFCVSGNATDYYWRNGDKSISFLSSFTRLLCNHWGSVVGGSFLNAFFQIPTLIAELLICHPTACCSKMGVLCYNTCSCFTCFFDLVRTDSYSYINMSGIPFCNASRECKKICQNSKHFIGTHSPIKHYRFIAHTFLLTAVLIAAWFILRARLWVYGFWNLTLIIVVIYITITWFIDINADAAQGLQTSYLAEHQLEPNHNLLQKLHPNYVGDLDQWQRRQLQDGNL